MSQEKYAKKIKLSAVEISTISICLRENIKSSKETLKTAKKEAVEGIKEYLKITSKLQKRFQHLATKIEKEVLRDIKNSK